MDKKKKKMEGLLEFRKQWMEELNSDKLRKLPDPLASVCGHSDSNCDGQSSSGGETLPNIKCMPRTDRGSFLQKGVSSQALSHSCCSSDHPAEVSKCTSPIGKCNDAIAVGRSSTSTVNDRLNTPAFDIAQRLLHGEILTHTDVFRHRLKRIHTDCSLNCKEECYENAMKSPRLGNMFYHMNKSIQPARLVDILITDLDEITDIPFFDITLPREIALKIFQYLSMVDLCNCAQVNKSWRKLSEDELLWSNLCHCLGYKMNVVTSKNKNWKCIVKDKLYREKKLKQNWKNRIGQLYELEGEIASVLSAVHSCQGYVVAGYSDGTVNLWNVGNNKEEELQCILNPESHMPGVELDLSTAVTSISINPNVITVGYSLGQVCILRSGSETQTPYCTSVGSCPVTATHCTGDICAVASDNIITVFNPSSESPLHLRHSSKISHFNLLPQVITGRVELISATSNAIYHYTLYAQSEESRIVHDLIASNVTAMDVSKNILAAGVTSRTSFNVFQVPVFSLDCDRILGTLLGHSGGILCVDMQVSQPNLVLTGCRDKQVRVYDLRTFSTEISITAHTFGVTQAQMDDNQIVTGGEDGFTCVWDLRSQKKLWEMHSRHPVRYLKFDATTLVTANIPENEVSYSEDGDTIVHKKQRGCLRMYDFSVDQEAKGIPSICLSAYDEPAGYNYNIKLSVPYDNIE